MLALNFHSTLDRLQALSRSHILYFRLEVGRLILQDFFGGDAAIYHSRDPHKLQSFRAFIEQCGPQLAELGFSEVGLRQSVLAHLAVAPLPPGTVEKLLFAHVLELARIPDPDTRGILALEAVEKNWTKMELRAATDAALGAEAAPPPAPPQLGRVVSNFEKAVGTIDSLTDQWTQLAGHKLSGRQKQRMHSSLEQLKAKIAAIEAQLS
jgi:hypothetical protein